MQDSIIVSTGFLKQNTSVSQHWKQKLLVVDQQLELQTKDFSYHMNLEINHLVSLVYHVVSVITLQKMSLFSAEWVLNIKKLDSKMTCIKESL